MRGPIRADGEKTLTWKQELREIRIVAIGEAQARIKEIVSR